MNDGCCTILKASVTVQESMFSVSTTEITDIFKILTAYISCIARIVKSLTFATFISSLHTFCTIASF